jgi:hypothetical protein
MVPVVARSASPKTKKGKVTCVTCKLKGCLGRCHFDSAAEPQTQSVKKEAGR